MSAGSAAGMSRGRGYSFLYFVFCCSRPRHIISVREIVVKYKDTFLGIGGLFVAVAMSKKNSRTRRASQLKFDRQRVCDITNTPAFSVCTRNDKRTGEKQQQERLSKAAKTTTATPKPGKRKPIRLRKNMVVRVR